MRARYGFVTTYWLALSAAACSYYTSAAADDSPSEEGPPDAATSTASASSSGQSASSGAPGTPSSASSSGASSSGASSSASSASSSSSTGGPQLSAFAQGVLDGLNAARTNANPLPMPPLPLLSWDDQLAETSAQYTNACDPDVEPPGGVVGDAALGVASAAFVVSSMTSAGVSYTYATNTCTDTNTYGCNLYKAVVLRSAEKVGCAVTTCFDRDVWACFVTPLGALDQRPY